MNQNRPDTAALAIFNANLMQKRSADREEKKWTSKYVRGGNGQGTALWV